MIITFLPRKGIALGVWIMLISITILPMGSSITLQPTPEPVTTLPDNNNDDQTMTVPEGVEIGDMMLVDLRLDQSNPWKLPGLYNEHSAIYIGNNTLIEANGVVRYRNYTQFCQWCKNYVFIRVKTANESQRLAAAEWAKSKIGFPYQVYFDFPWFGIKIADTDRKIPTADEIY